MHEIYSSIANPLNNTRLRGFMCIRISTNQNGTKIFELNPVKFIKKKSLKEVGEGVQFEMALNFNPYAIAIWNGMTCTAYAELYK